MFRKNIGILLWGMFDGGLRVHVGGAVIGGLWWTDVALHVAVNVVVGVVVIIIVIYI